MPITFTSHPITDNYADRKTLDSCIVTAVNHCQGVANAGGSTFRGIQIDVPFGKKGSTKIRDECKSNGARWDGSTWMVPSTVYVADPTKIEWFRSMGLLKAIVVSHYTEWKWDGDTTKDLMLDVPFDQRKLVKGIAIWSPVDHAWNVPAKNINSWVVTTLNTHHFIVGYRSSTAHASSCAPTITIMTKQPPAPAPAPAPAPKATVVRPPGAAADTETLWKVEQIITNKAGHKAPVPFTEWLVSHPTFNTLQCFQMNIPCGDKGATLLFVLDPAADRAYTFLFDVGFSFSSSETVRKFFKTIFSGAGPEEYVTTYSIRAVVQQHLAQARDVFETVGSTYATAVAIGVASLGFYVDHSQELQEWCSMGPWKPAAAGAGADTETVGLKAFASRTLSAAAAAALPPGT